MKTFHVGFRRVDDRKWDSDRQVGAVSAGNDRQVMTMTGVDNRQNDVLAKARAAIRAVDTLATDSIDRSRGGSPRAVPAVHRSFGRD